MDTTQTTEPTPAERATALGLRSGMTESDVLAFLAERPAADLRALRSAAYAAMVDERNRFYIQNGDYHIARAWAHTLLYLRRAAERRIGAKRLTPTGSASVSSILRG